MVSSDITPAAAPSRHAGRRPRTAERGFTLAAVIVLLTIISVTIAYTVPPQWSKIMERERDRQTIFAMKQVARAIYEFRRKNNAFPTSLEQLEKARQPRMLRGNGMPVDPSTGSADTWLILPAGAGPGSAGGLIIGGNIADGSTSTAGGGPPGTPGTTIPGVPAKDFVGPIGGIRPSRTGKSFLVLNGKENYEEWSYTVSDLEQELQQRQASMTLIR